MGQHALFQSVKRWIHQVLASLDTAIVSTGALTAANVTDSALTSGRVPIASTNGLLVDDADLTFSGATLTATGLSVGATGASVTGAITPTGGIVATSPKRITNIPIGTVAYGSIGTDAAHVAGTIYASEIFVPANKTIAGIGILNGTTVGTDKLIFALADSAGTVVATTALAGTDSAGSDVFQEIALTAPYAAKGPARYLLLVQCNGTTACTQRIAAATYPNLAGSDAGAFGTIASVTVPTATVADTGPIGYVYSA